MKANLLVVDDELGARESLKAIFGKLYEVELADCAAEALRALSRRRIDLVLLDVILPDRNGLDLLKDIQSLYPDMPVVMISASASVRPVVEAMRVGACDYVAKPFDVGEIRRIVKRCIDSQRLHRRVEVLESEVAREFPVDGVVGNAPAFRAALGDVRKAADTDSTVLIQGESGTGKELAARLLHALSSRRDAPFVAVHCAALPESLMESELFGHERGAFTGAEKMKPGRFDLAAGGTLFFDEVGEMRLSTQVKLLRVLQEREFMRVGGTRSIRTDVRIVAATALDLRRESREGRFREDFYYRLSVVPVTLPPLRHRREDIPLLIRHFLATLGSAMNARLRHVSPEAMTLLARYEWPGNIRELRNIVERMLVLHRNEDVLVPDVLPEEFHSQAPAPSFPDLKGRPYGEAVLNFERHLIERALREAGGIQTRAAERLGTTRRILGYRIEKLKIDVNRPGNAVPRDAETSRAPRREP